MGQSWQIINLDTMEVLCWLGKLGESIWNEHANLVSQLCPPLEPPKSPRKAVTPVAAALTRHSVDPDHYVRNFDDLLAIPELLIVVFEFLDNYFDCLSFGLTNSEVWACGERIIQQRYSRFCAKWQGARLICLGGYSSDLPDQLNNARDLAQLASSIANVTRDNGNSEESEPWDLQWFSRQLQPSSPTHRPLATSSSVVHELQPPTEPANVSFADLDTDAARDEWSKHLEHLSHKVYARSGRLRGIPVRKRVLREIESMLDPFGWTHPPAVYRWSHRFLIANPPPVTTRPVDSDLETKQAEAEVEKAQVRAPVMILRNLTKRQYICSNDFAVTNKDSVWGFGRALLARICWSSVNSTAIPYEGDLHRGVWAGDAFDIKPASAFYLDPESKPRVPDGWTDLTNDVRDELIAIWKSDWGSNWERNAW